MNTFGDTFSSSEECKKQYQNAQCIHIIADGKVVGYVYGPHDPMWEKYTYTYRIGGMNCSALNQKDAITKLLSALESSPVAYENNIL